jgi:large subunit ribosomal protein L17
MRHRKSGNPLGRNTSHRKALLRNMVTSLFKYEQIETTDAKAKAIRPVAEKLITLAKRGDLHSRRQALAYIQDKGVTHRLFEEIRDRYLDRQGGYLRIVKKGTRKGDGASVSIVQLIKADEEQKQGRKKSKKSKAEKGKVDKPKKQAVEGKTKKAEPKKAVEKAPEDSADEAAGKEEDTAPNDESVSEKGAKD